MNDRDLVAVLLPLVRKFIWAVDGQMWDLGTFPPVSWHWNWKESGERMHVGSGAGQVA